MKVFLNPGHMPPGQGDPGAVGNGLHENEVALSVTNAVAEYLKAAGVEIAGIFQGALKDICINANNSGADLFISIHCNAFHDTSANGTEVCVHPASTVGKKLGQYVQNQIVSALGTTDRGLKLRQPGVNGLAVLNGTKMPAILIELAFITNPDDAALLRDKQDDFARAIARGVTDYISNQ